MKPTSLLLACLLIPCTIIGQNLPLEVRITEDNRLVSGGNPTTGFYNPEVVHKLEITLTQSNWFQLMDGERGPGGGEGELLIGTLTYNDTLVLDSVLVGIKGQTSDSRNNSEKKSFKIEIDELVDQDLLGYDNLNLNCAFQDHSGMREVLYYDISRAFSPALKGSFIDLYINGQYWGPYNNIQQVEGRYIKEWFLDNDGTRWRAVAPDGVGGGMGGPGGGNRFGQGVSTLNYNGLDSSDYNENYTLKSTSKENPWEDLIETCDLLNSLPIAHLYDSLKHKLDIDRALWVLAQEMVFVDDDSYIHKGGMDYYVYWDITTDRIMPMEVDGNSVLASNHIDWSPFYNADNTDFPLLNRLMQNTEIRQRYLAHVRTILKQHFTENEVHDRIDAFAALLDQRVQDDPKKLYSYTQFTTGVQSLKDLITSRITYLQSNNEINREGVEISDLLMETTAGPGMAPKSGEAVQVRVNIGDDAQKVLLYYGLGLDGVFDRIEMFDDGMHNDGQADDNIYGAEIPAQSSGNYVRYYVEAIQNDNYSTSSYFPEGAEHDVYIYQVEPGGVSTDHVVINEIMADNGSTEADNAGEYDDWIELYNNSDVPIDLTGHYLSDNQTDIKKWSFPDNTVIEAHGFLIIWADNDVEQAGTGELHANFKLSSEGEEVILSNSDMVIQDMVEFASQVEDKSYARKPNGVGSFEISDHTFNSTNDDGSYVQASFLYPNPASTQITIKSETALTEGSTFLLYNSLGQEILSVNASTAIAIDISHVSAGIYFAVLRDDKEDLVLNQKVLIARP